MTVDNAKRSSSSTPPVEAKTLRTERDDRVLTVTLDNPPRQFMNWQMVQDLERLIASIEDDRGIRSVVFTGAADDIFLNHYDVGEILESSGDGGPPLPYAAARIGLKALETVARVPAASEAILRSPAAAGVWVRRIHDLFLRMNRMDKVFVAAINGHTVAGGCEFALACDLRIMADGRRLALPEVALGVMPGFGGVQRLTRAVGASSAIELLLDARDLDANAAHEIGIVHRVVSSDALAEEAAATARRLARRSPAAVWAIKRAVYEGAAMTLPRGLAFDRTVFAVAGSSASARRGITAMVEEIRGGGGAGPGKDPDALNEWRDGTVVDLAAD